MFLTVALPVAGFRSAVYADAAFSTLTVPVWTISALMAPVFRVSARRPIAAAVNAVFWVVYHPEDENLSATSPARAMAPDMSPARTIVSNIMALSRRDEP